MPIVTLTPLTPITVRVWPVLLVAARRRSCPGRIDEPSPATRPIPLDPQVGAAGDAHRVEAAAVLDLDVERLGRRSSCVSRIVAG